MTTLWLDCSAGAAGDMLLGALLDAGAPLNDVRSELEKLNLDGWTLELAETTRAGLRAAKAVVGVSDGAAARSYRDIVESIEGSDLRPQIKSRALAAFEVLARAEARVHGGAIEDIHLHEVGAIDAIVDVVGVCAAVEFLDPEEILCSTIEIGSGSIESAHGSLPVPSPAAAEIMNGTGARLTSRLPGETLTPTGAALLAVLVEDFGTVPTMTLTAIGYGAGDRDSETPNLVRAFLGESVDVDTDTWLVETNIDDMNAELVPYVLDELLDAGALDAWAVPATMKKGRSGIVISALTEPVHNYHVLEILFRETTTFGIRFSPVRRAMLDRHWVDVQVEGIVVRVKVGSRAEDVVSVSPEFEDARAVAEKTGLPLKEVYRLAEGAARAQLGTR